MNAIRKGDGTAIDYVCSSSVDAGDIVVIEEIAGIATCGGDAGDKIGLATHGVFDFVSTGTASAGDKMYWNGTAATTTSAGAGSGNWSGFIGYLVRDLASGEKARVLFSAPGGSTGAAASSGLAVKSGAGIGGGYSAGTGSVPVAKVGK